MNQNVYLEAPNRLERYSHLDRNRTVFLAGSITGAWNWQDEARQWLYPKFSVFNPCRENFDTADNAIERDQIQWEYAHLDIAGITLFYFSGETLAPITLLEYGKQLVKAQYAPWRKTYVCIDPRYKRKNDVTIQTELVNPSLLANFYPDIASMCQAIIKENA